MTNLIMQNSMKQNTNRTPHREVQEDAKIFIWPYSKDKTDLRAINNAENTVNENYCASWTNLLNLYHFRNMKDM